MQLQARTVPAGMTWRWRHGFFRAGPPWCCEECVRCPQHVQRGIHTESHHRRGEYHPERKHKGRQRGSDKEGGGPVQRDHMKALIGDKDNVDGQSPVSHG